MHDLAYLFYIFDKKRYKLKVKLKVNVEVKVKEKLRNKK